MPVRPIHSICRALARLNVIAVAAVLVASGAVLGEAPMAHADGEVTWAVRTGSNAFGADRSSYVYTLAPGTSVDDSLVVTSHSSQDLDLAVYASDGFTNDTGQLDLLPGGAASHGVGAFLRGKADRITLHPGQSVDYPFSVTIPGNATPGDYVGGIVTTLTVPGQASGVNVDRRLGIRVKLRVSGDLAPSMTVENLHVSWNGGLNPLARGDATIAYTVRNNGNTTLKAQQTAVVTGPFGWFPVNSAQIGDSPELLPGETWQVSTTAPRIAAFLWLTGTVTVRPLLIDLAGSTSPLPEVSSSASSLALPWMLLLVLVLVGSGVVLGLWQRKRRTVQRKAQEDARVDAAVAEALADAGQTPDRATGDAPPADTKGIQ